MVLAGVGGVFQVVQLVRDVVLVVQQQLVYLLAIYAGGAHNVCNSIVNIIEEIKACDYSAA